MMRLVANIPVEAPRASEPPRTWQSVMSGAPIDPLHARKSEHVCLSALVLISALRA